MALSDSSPSTIASGATMKMFPSLRRPGCHSRSKVTANNREEEREGESRKTLLPLRDLTSRLKISWFSNQRGNTARLRSPYGAPEQFANRYDVGKIRTLSAGLTCVWELLLVSVKKKKKLRKAEMFFQTCSCRVGSVCSHTLLQA